jgi:hypothetical protein
MSGMFTLHSDPLAVNQQKYWYRSKSNGEKAQQGTAPLNSQSLEHSRGKQREPSPKSTPDQVIPSQNAAYVLGVCISLIEQDGVEQENSSHGKERRADDRHDPVNIFS